MDDKYDIHNVLHHFYNFYHHIPRTLSLGTHHRQQQQQQKHEYYQLHNVYYHQDLFHPSRSYLLSAVSVLAVH